MPDLVHEHTLVGIERRQLHEHAVGYSGAAVQREPHAARRARVAFDDLDPLDVELPAPRRTTRRSARRLRPVHAVGAAHRGHGAYTCQTPDVTRVNRQVVLRARPQVPSPRTASRSSSAPVPELGPGEALLEVKYVGIDPTIRGWLDERGNYMPGVADRRAHPLQRRRRRRRDQRRREVSARARVHGAGRLAAVPGARGATSSVPVTIVDENVELLDALNVLGHVGLTAYLGVTEVAKPGTGRDVPRVGRGQRRRRRSRARSRSCGALG